MIDSPVGWQSCHSVFWSIRKYSTTSVERITKLAFLHNVNFKGIIYRKLQFIYWFTMLLDLFGWHFLSPIWEKWSCRLHLQRGIGLSERRMFRFSPSPSVFGELSGISSENCWIRKFLKLKIVEIENYVFL